MAAKNPARVAAGKKAWANRSASSKRKSTGLAKRRGGRRKPIQRGVVGRVGALMLGVAPVAISAFEAAAAAQNLKKTKGLTGLGAVSLGFYRFVNNLTYGFLGVSPLKGMKIPTESGRDFVTGDNVGIPKGSLLAVSGTGLFMLLEDYIASKLAGGRPIKIMGTNYNATGGS